MRPLYSCLLALFWFSTAESAVAADLVVIVNPQSGVQKMTQAEVASIYTAKTRQLPSGVAALPLDMNIEAEARKDFYQRLLGKSVAEINAYWARLLFSGRATPPHQMFDAAAIVETVAQNKGAIAYVERDKIDKRVRVVLELRE